MSSQPISQSAALTASQDATPDSSGTPDTTALLPTLALVAAVLLWGGSFPAMRTAVQVLDPWAVIWTRMAVAVAVLLPFARRLMPERGAYRRGDWKLLLGMALFQPCAYFLLESNALRYTTSSQAGVVAASVPLLVALGAALTLGETVRPRTWVGLLLSMAGVAWLTLAGGSSGANAVSGSNPLLGNALELGAMGCAAAGILILKKLCDRYGPWTLTALQALTGVLFFLPGLPMVMDAGTTIWNTPLIISVLFLGIGASLGAFGLYNWAVSRMPASRASAFINLVPVAAVTFGWLILGESLTPMQCLAAGLVFVGVWRSQDR